MQRRVPMIVVDRCAEERHAWRNDRSDEILCRCRRALAAHGYRDGGLWRSLVIPPAPLPDLPATEQEVTAVAAQVGLRVPAACMPGVIGNLALLARHAAILRERYNNPA